VEHPDVDKIAFTGGRDTGAEIMRRAAGTLKRVTLELGGKSPVMVFPDAPDLDTAAFNAVGSVAFGLSGQGCACVTRALVHRDCYDAFMDAAGRALDQVRQGFSFDETTNAGPLISPRHRERVLELIASGRTDGATLVRGGREAGGPGFFVEPALFADATSSMRIWRDEIFGPVLTVVPFSSVDEAIALANDTTYGLAGQVWTTDLRVAMRVVRSVRTGTIGVNGYEVVPTAPFGGVRRSGFGREGGRDALDAYTSVKNVFFDLSV
jgi:aldehyde dehydrogenase (NAD+)